MSGNVVIIGSGELADTMAETHRQLMTRLNAPPVPVFVDTMAGFELNIDQIDQKAEDYFKRNFGLNLLLARYRRADDGPEVTAAAMSAVQRANYLFAGPGSPSYGIRMWRDSKVWQTMVNCWQDGACLVFASAAAITLGKHALPVYEIYKVGQDPYWLPGLDLIGTLGLDVAVVPHWNNTSGDQHDTRFCFMGGARLAQLEAQLPADTLVLGVDEYTALLIDPATREGEVFGVGQVTLRRNGQQVAYNRGQRFSLLQTIDTPASVIPVSPKNDSKAAVTADNDIADLRAAVQMALGQGSFPAAVDGLFALSLIAEAGLEQGQPQRTEGAVQALQVLLPLLSAVKHPTNDQASFEAECRELVDLLIDMRAELRKAKQWAAADQVRDRLAALGYVLTDSPAGTTWQRVKVEV